VPGAFPEHSPLGHKKIKSSDWQR